MNNKVEILRSICFTEKDLENVTNLADSFTKKEIEFMVEFKKIYELGLEQLKKFIDKLDEEGKDLDTYTIQYYVELLQNGPLGGYLPELTKDKKYFTKTPDSMGLLGNKTKSFQNNTIFETIEYPLGCSVDLYNKLPPFIQTTIQDSIKITEDVFRGSLKSSSEVDNTLPVADKATQKRYYEENTGMWVRRSNGSYMVKDMFFYLAVDSKSQQVFDKVKELLQDENFRIYKDKKEYNPFDSSKNESTATNNKIEKEFVDGDNKQTITLDLMGDEFDSFDRRDTALKISNPSKDKEYPLHTNEGQLGN